MDKNIRLAAIIFALALVLGSFSLGRETAPGGLLGSQTVNYTNSGNSANLYNSLQSLLQDITAVRNPLAGITVCTTASLDFPALSTSTANYAAQAATTTQVTNCPAAAGSQVLVQSVTVNPGTVFLGDVNTASTTSATFDIWANASSVFTNPVASTFTITIIPNTFTAPAALNTVSSTSN